MRFLTAILFVILVATRVEAQRPFTRDFWLNESATPEKINTIAQSRDGYIWLCADAGLYRFNGRSFVHLNDSLHQPVTAITNAGDTLYIGYKNGGLAYVYKGDIVALHLTGAKPKSRITSLKYHYGCLWAGTEAEGIFAIHNERGHNINTDAGLTDNFIYALNFTAEDKLLAATDQGINVLAFMPDGRLSIHPLFRKNALPDNIVRVLRKTSDAQQKLWGGMEDKGLFRIEADTPIIFMQDWHWGALNDVLPVTGTHAWAATDNGYLLDCRYLDNGKCDVKAYVFEGKKFNKLLQDMSGNIWCATNDGLTMVTDNYITYLRMEDRYKLRGLTAMTCDNRNILWYALDNDLYGMALQVPQHPQKAFSATAPITSLYEDGAHRLWIGTLGGGLWCKDSTGIQAVKSLSGVTGGHILDISGREGKLWVSSLNGVEELNINGRQVATPEVVRHHGKSSGAGSDYIYDLYPDSKGRMWMATDGAGITMWDGSTYKTWDSTSGFPSKVVYSITEDAAGNIWAATLEDGLYEYDGSKWNSISGKHGLQDLSISTIAANATGQVVVVHTKGIDEWYPQSKEFRHFNRRLGVDIDSQSTTLNCYATDTAGNVWIPFEHGFICFHNLDHPYNIKPAIQINDVSLFFKPIETGKQDFGPGENYIGFRYDGINFTNPEKLYYRYMLEGYDNSWVRTNDDAVTFPRLPAGRYKFRVQASLSSLFNESAEATYSFKIATSIWKRPWAIVLMALLLAAIGYAYLRVREHNLRRLAQLQKERMMFEYEHLKSQVNPHFLFNSLNTLASLIDEDPHTAVNYTVELSELYRNMLAYRDKDLIALSEEWALLKKYFYVQQSRFATGLFLDEHIPADLCSEKKIIPLALQLVVENAIKHNVVSKDLPLTIHILANDSSITVRHRIQPKISKEKGAGLGLANIRKRYALLTKVPVQFGRVGDEYIVTLPLL